MSFDLKNLICQAGTIVTMLAASAMNAQAYDAPIGIPEPPFGIDETHYQYAGKFYAAGGFDYRDAGNGPYTHYIDNSSPNCTNNNNPYGTESSPRCSLPSNSDSFRRMTIPEGSVIEIHGGNDTPYSMGGIYQINAEGTQQNPIFFRGYSASESEYPTFIKSDIRIAGQYAIFEQLDIYDDSNFTIHPKYDLSGDNTSNHLSVRSMHIHEPVGDSGDMNGSSAVGEYIVYYKNHVHHNWKSDLQDAHGLYIGEGSRYAWILENHIYGNSGNAFQTCNACTQSPPEYVYIGKNIMHEDKELAIGLKYGNHIIISQNKIYGYHESATAQGTGIVIGADGPTSNVWIIFNEIYDAPYGIRIEETYTDTHILGNIIYNITNSALNLEKEGPDVYLYNNTIDNVGQFINQTWQDDFRVHARNNIFSNETQQVAMQLISSSVVDNSYITNSLLYDSDGSVTVYWGSQRETYSSTNELSRIPSSSGLIMANPSYVRPSEGNYGLSLGSPAINSGATSANSEPPYDTYKSRYGIDIQVDFLGNRRPAAGGWDMGAFEFEGLTISPPLAPTNVEAVVTD